MPRNEFKKYIHLFKKPTGFSEMLDTVGNSIMDFTRKT